MPATTGMTSIARKASLQAIAAVLITGGFFSAMAAPAFDFIVDLRTADREDAAARGPGGFGHPGSRGGLLARCIQL